MTNEDILSNFNLFAERNWRKTDLERWYKIDFTDPPTQQLLVQANWFAGTFEWPTTLREDLGDQLDHWHWELFLQRRELVPITEAASELAMSVDDFRNVANRFIRSPGVSVVGNPWANNSNCIVRRSFLRDFHKGFESLRRTIFANHPAYIHRIHDEIQTVFSITVETKIDRTDLALREPFPRPGYYIDCLTGEPIGLGREVFLETRKPIELAPDYCSWLTFAKHEDLLRPHMLGDHRPGLDAEMLERLRNA